VPGSATRLDYVYRDDDVGEEGDPHPVVRIKAINFSREALGRNPPAVHGGVRALSE
jgi:hypothetical protein